MNTAGNGSPANPSGEAPLATLEFRRGELRGSHLSLFQRSLVHRAGDYFEVIPLAMVGSLRAGFERDSSRMNRGGILLAAALLVLGAYWPLRALVSIAFGELNPQSQGGGAFLPSALAAADFCVGLFPLLAAIIASWGIAYMVFAWIGNSVLAVSIGAADRSFASFGRDPALFEFAEAVAARLDTRT